MTTDELKKLVEAATPGPWIGHRNEGVYENDDETPVFETGCGCCSESTLSEENARLIAAAPALAREVIALREAAGEFLRCENAVEAEAARAEKDGGWSLAPVVARSYALAKLRAVLGESE